MGISAGSLSAGSIFAQILNTRGSSIGGTADLFVASTGAITSVGDATFRIVNFDNGADFGGGSIGGDATINVSAARLSAATLLARIII